jgi:hypothetical protein
VRRSGLSFDHILNRLQGELTKMRDRGSELCNVVATLENVGEVLGVSLVSFPSSLLLVMPPSRFLSSPFGDLELRLRVFMFCSIFIIIYYKPND